MKKSGFGLIMVAFTALVTVLISGCISVSTEKMPRVDQEQAGNQGYMIGNAQPAEKTAESKEMAVTKVRIELPPYVSWEKYEWQDKEVTGNRGYLVGGPKAEK